jgi:hypothetical protein
MVNPDNPQMLPSGFNRANQELERTYQNPAFPPLPHREKIQVAAFAPENAKLELRG